MNRFTGLTLNASLSCTTVGIPRAQLLTYQLDFTDAKIKITLRYLPSHDKCVAAILLSSGRIPVRTVVPREFSFLITLLAQ